MIAVAVLVGLAAQAQPTTADAPAPTLDALRAMVEDLRCDDAAASIDAVVSGDGPAADRRTAYFLRGYCSSIAGLNARADEDFRAAWQLDLGAPVPLQVEPGVLVIINGARDAVVRVRDQRRSDARDAMRAKVKVVASAPPQIAGGRRLPITATLTDPEHHATRIRLEFRRDNEPDAFTLPMQLDAGSGTWRGEVPGLYTLTRDGAFTMTWRVLGLDDEGVLAESASSEKPGETFVTRDDALVPELRANERLPHGQRILYASLGFGAAVVFTGLASVATSSLLGIGIYSYAPVLDWPLRIVTALAPVGLTATVAYAAVDPLVDGSSKIWPPLIVLASSLPAAVAALVLSPSQGTDYIAWVGGFGVVVGGLGTAIAAAVTTGLVIADPVDAVSE
jgi:hypothetical protein